MPITKAKPDACNQPYDNWFIDVIRAHRKKIAMIRHAHSLLTFLIPYAEVGDTKAIPDSIPVLINQFWKHALQKSKRIYNPRINLIFRNICTNQEKK